jgi:hypothetical protein
MPDGAVITFAPFVLERDDFLVFALLDYLGAHLCSTEGDFAVIDMHQRLKRRRLARLDIEKIDIDRVTLRDAVLPAASIDNCVSHKIRDSGEEKEANTSIDLRASQEKAVAASLQEGCTSRTPRRLQRRNQQHNLTFRWMRLVMREKLTRGPAPEFLEFFCQLSGNAELSILENIDAGGQCFR